MTTTSTVQAIIPAASQADVDANKFSPGLIVDGWLHIAGQIGVGPDGKPPIEPADQARLAFESIGRILSQAGATFSNLVTLTTYHVGDVSTNPEWFNPVKDDFITEAPFPAWTSVGVTSLAISGAVLEISAIAYIGG